MGKRVSQLICAASFATIVAFSAFSTAYASDAPTAADGASPTQVQQAP